jgi:2-methylfumaryl-CoA isomerase
VKTMQRPMESVALTGPLTGLRIIELATFVAGPLGGMSLAQLGADVIRVDPLGGAVDTRRLPMSPSGTSLYWTALNKGKRSVMVDVKSPRGQELVTELIRRSGANGGILLTNAAARGWLSYENLRRHRPDLVQLSILGRRDGRTAVDYTVNAASGFPFVTGPEDHALPVNHMLPAWDLLCGLYAAVGLLAADRWRRLTGEGREIRLALEDVALASAGNLGLLTEAQVNNVARDRYGNFVYGVFGKDFATLDGRRIMLVAMTSRHWEELLRLTGLTEVVAGLERQMNVSFTEDVHRFRYREVIVGLLKPWFESRTLGEVEAALATTSLLWSRYRSFLEIVEEGRSELEANPMMSIVDQPGVGRFLAPGSPLAFDGLPGPASPAPRLGEHTDAILAELLELSGKDLAELHDEGVVGGAR